MELFLFLFIVRVIYYCSKMIKDDETFLLLYIFFFTCNTDSFSAHV